MGFDVDLTNIIKFIIEFFIIIILLIAFGSIIVAINPFMVGIFFVVVIFILYKLIKEALNG